MDCSGVPRIIKDLLNVQYKQSYHIRKVQHTRQVLPISCLKVWEGYGASARPLSRAATAYNVQ